jgi:lipid-A-disaccharide synthase
LFFQKLLPIFISALNLFVAQNHLSNVYAVFPCVSQKQKELIKNYAPKMQFKYIIAENKDKADLYAASNLALVKSGTSSLELAIAGVPMVVAYKVNHMTAFIAKYIMKLRSYVSIINILANKMVIPEKLQGDCNPVALSKELRALLDKNMAAQQVEACRLQLAKLQSGTKFLPSENAAIEVLSLLAIK